MTLPNLVGVKRAAAGPDTGADRRALSATSESANARAGCGSCSYSQFVTMFLPKAPLVTTMTNSSSGCRGCCRCRLCCRD